MNIFQKIKSAAKNISQKALPKRMVNLKPVVKTTTVKSAVKQVKKTGVAKVTPKVATAIKKIAIKRNLPAATTFIKKMPINAPTAAIKAEVAKAAPSSFTNVKSPALIEAANPIQRSFSAVDLPYQNPSYDLAIEPPVTF